MASIEKEVWSKSFCNVKLLCFLSRLHQPAFQKQGDVFSVPESRARGVNRGVSSSLVNYSPT